VTESSAKRAADPLAALAPIRIAAAVINKADGRTLLVRKRGSRFFIQPGGKIEAGESPIEALARELREEVGLLLIQAEFVGDFSNHAANEPSRTVEAQVFDVTVEGEPRLGAEIEEAIWVDPSSPGDFLLAPLTREQILPLVAPRFKSSATGPSTRKALRTGPAGV
jgi:8-oxo-dGTP diphosphatase